MTTLMAPIAFQPREAETVGAFVLVPTLGGAPWILRRGRHVLGSGPEATLQLSNEGISAQHCLLIVGPSSAIVKAWDSRTWINDGPVREATLKPNDRLTIGPWTFRFRSATADELLQFVPENSASNGPVANPSVVSDAPTVLPVTAISAVSLPATETNLISEIASSSASSLSISDDRLEKDLASDVTQSAENSPSVEPKPESAVADREVIKQELQRTLASVMEQRLHLEQAALDQTRTLAVENSRLVEQRTELERLRTQLVRRETEFSLRMQAIETTESAQQTLRKELERTQIKLLQRQVELAEAEQTFQKQVEEKTVSLQQLERNLLQSQAEHAQAVESLAIQKQALTDFELQLARREAELRDDEAIWQVKFAAQKSEAEAIEKQLADMESRSEALALLEQSLSRREAEVASKDSELSQLKAAFVQQEEELQRARHEMDLQRSTLAHDLAQLAIQQSEQAAREAAIDERHQALDLRERALVSEKNRIEQIAEAARISLQEEQARQEETWSRWDESMRKATADLRAQMEALEQERASLEAMASGPQLTPEVVSSPSSELDSVVPAAVDSFDGNIDTRAENQPAIVASTLDPMTDVPASEQAATALETIAAAVEAPSISDEPAEYAETAEAQSHSKIEDTGIDHTEINGHSAEPALAEDTLVDHSEIFSENLMIEPNALIESDTETIMPGTVDWLPVTPGESYVPEVDHSETISTPVDPAAALEVAGSQEFSPVGNLSPLEPYHPTDEFTPVGHSSGLHESLDGNFETEDQADSLPAFDISSINPWANEVVADASQFEEPAESTFGEPLASRRLWNEPEDEIPAAKPASLTSLSKNDQLANDSAVSDPALSLRAELAQLFGIQDLGASRPSVEESESQEAELASYDDSAAGCPEPVHAHEPRDSMAAHAEDSAATFSERGLNGGVQEPEAHRFSAESSTTPSESMATADAHSANAVSREATPSDAAQTADEEEDSVASYMARLLGRYGQKAEAPVKTSRPVESSASSQASHKLVQEVATTVPEVPVTWSEEPRHKVDKDEFRAHLESMRQVANVSARTAVKSSHWKRSRMQVLVKGMLAAGALATGSVLLLGKFANGQPQLMQGLVVTVVGIYLLLETIKGVRRVQTSAQLQLALAHSAELEGRSAAPEARQE
ncbi:FHA domain-containing protein [Planctopirus hydrillae]|nr:FHA domain-containing protein [Planctopirus hydrillae]